MLVFKEKALVMKLGRDEKQQKTQSYIMEEYDRKGYEYPNNEEHNRKGKEEKKDNIYISW